MKLFLQILLIVTSVFLVVAVLLHRGRGGGLSSLFGGGMQSSLAGSSVAEKNLDRITLLLGAVWLISIVGLGLLLKVCGVRRPAVDRDRVTTAGRSDSACLLGGAPPIPRCEDSWLAVTRFEAPGWVPVLRANPSEVNRRHGAGSATGAPTATKPGRRSRSTRRSPTSGTAPAVGSRAGRTRRTRRPHHGPSRTRLTWRT